jgi:hypothetical protein
MLNFVHTFGATKNEFKVRGSLLAPSAIYAGTTEGTCTEATFISFAYNHMGQKYINLLKSRLFTPQLRWRLQKGAQSQ